MSAVSLMEGARVRTSSTLNGDVKQFGKKFMLDGREDTCWNSDQGTPQSVEILFEAPVTPSQLRIMFQGGFAGNDCKMLGREGDGGEFSDIFAFYPEDINSLQEFDLPQEAQRRVKAVRLEFLSSTDFFGRITIYILDIQGQKH